MKTNTHYFITKRTFLLVCFFILLVTPKLKADSPLTSTEFSSAYFTTSIYGYNVDELWETPLYDIFLDDLPNWVDILYSDSVSLGEKMALVNYLGWDTAYKNEKTLIYLEFLINENPTYETFYELGMENLIEKLTAEETLILAYINAMDNHTNVSTALDIAKLAEFKDTSNSFIFKMIRSLIEAQDAFLKNNWCKAYQITDAVRKDKSLKQDMKQEAIDLIYKYMDIYKDNCD